MRYNVTEKNFILFEFIRRNNYLTTNLEILLLDIGNKFNDVWLRVLLAIIHAVVIIPTM